jgi:WD40 repeat protein
MASENWGGLAAWVLVLSLAEGSLAAAEDKAPRLLLPIGHTHAVTSVALSADGKHVLTGSDDQTARLWNVESGKTLQSFSGHTNAISSVALSADGQRILTGSWDNTARLWDVKSGKPLQVFSGHTDGVLSVALSTDAKRILTGSYDGTARLWDAESGKPLRTFIGHNKAVTSVTLSPDGKRVLTGSWDRTARLWDAESGKTLQSFSGHTDGVHSVVLSADGKRVLTGSSDKTARVWDAESGKTLQTFSGHTDAIHSVALSADGQRVLTGSWDRTARLWVAEGGKSLLTFSGHINAVSSVVLSMNGKHVLTGSYDHTARLWDAESGKVLKTFCGYTYPIKSLALSMDGQCVLTGSSHPTARLSHLGSGKTIRTFSGHSEGDLSVALSAGGKRILTGSKDRTARLWDAESGKPLRTLSDHTGWVTSVALSADDKRVLTGSYDRTARLWDAETGKGLQTFSGHTGWITSVALSADGKRVLTGADDNFLVWTGDTRGIPVGASDKTARLWDAATGKVLQTFSGHTSGVRSVALSADGKRVLTGSDDRTARLWDTESGKTLQTFSGHTERIGSVALSGNGKLVLTGSDDRTARLWDADSGKILQTFSGHTGWVTSVAFGPRAMFLVTASEDGTVSVWNPNRPCPLYSFLHTGDEWLNWTPEGYYTCSPGGENLIAWKVRDDSPHGYRIVAPEQFRKQFHRPDLFPHLFRELDLTRALAKADEERIRKEKSLASIAEAIPPVVVITQPHSAREVVKTEEYEIAAQAVPVGDNHVTAVQLLLDGRPYNLGRARRIFAPKPGLVRVSWKVKLPAGPSRVQVVAESVKGSTQRSDEVVLVREDDREALPTLLLLSVGVSQYSKVNRRGVEYTASDAQRFLKAQLEHGRALYRARTHTIRLPEDRDSTGKATKGDLLDALEEVGKKAREAKKPVTLIFLAGHGKVDALGNFYFLTADSDPDKLRSSAVSGTELKAALRDMPGRVVLFLDACHSGAFAGDTRSEGLTEDLFRDLTSDECGVVMVCSSRGKEVSRQRNMGEKGGLFTLALVEGLSGKAARDRNGAIYLPALFEYVNKRVKELSDNQQHPYASDLKRAGELPLTKPE